MNKQTDEGIRGMRRYSLDCWVKTNGEIWCNGSNAEDEDGEWVRWSDVVRLLDAWENEPYDRGGPCYLCRHDSLDKAQQPKCEKCSGWDLTTGNWDNFEMEAGDG